MVKCRTTAYVLGRKEKRRRKAPHMVEYLIKSLLKVFNLYELVTFQIILKMRATSHLRYLIDHLLLRGFKISSIIVLRRIPYSNGMRGRKLRKI